MHIIQNLHSSSFSIGEMSSSPGLCGDVSPPSCSSGVLLDTGGGGGGEAFMCITEYGESVIVCASTAGRRKSLSFVNIYFYLFVLIFTRESALNPKHERNKSFNVLKGTSRYICS